MHNQCFRFFRRRTASAVAFFASSSLVYTETVFSTDFSRVPSELDVAQGGVPFTLRAFDYVGSGQSTEGSQSIDVGEFGATGQWLFTPTAGNYKATLTLSNLGPHRTLDIGFLLLAGGGIDGYFGGQNDGVEIMVDGQTVFGPIGFGGRSPDRPGYQDTDEGKAAALIRTQGVDGAPASNINSYRTGAWGHDALYDMSLDPSLQGIPHTASSATIEFIANRSEADNDEYFGFANLVVETDAGGGRSIPEITQVNYVAETNTINLTWPSSEGETYTVFYSFDLVDWNNELDDNAVAGAGERTSQSYSLNGIVTDQKVVFFRIQRQ